VTDRQTSVTDRPTDRPTVVCSAKTAAPIEMPFGLRTRVGPSNHVLDGGPDPPWANAILRGKGRPIVKYRDTLRSSVQNG